MKILLLEEHPIYREALIEILRARIGELEIEAVATVGEAHEALARGPRQLVLADFSTADAGGRPGLEGVAQASAGAILATLDARPIPAHARRALLAGAKAYIPKTSTRELVDAALGVVLAGGSYYPDIGPARAPERTGVHAKLSPRQAEVMDLLEKGLRNPEIAQALGISVATVKLHVHAILKATGARSRTDLLLRKVRAAQ
jgi:DNA-binding NarL/FixJ family response regulator